MSVFCQFPKRKDASGNPITCGAWSRYTTLDGKLSCCSVHVHAAIMLNANTPVVVTECSICLSNIPAKKAMVLPCKHAFHRSCATKWIRNHNSCPLCRHQVWYTDGPASNAQETEPIISTDASQPHGDTDDDEELLSASDHRVFEFFNWLTVIQPIVRSLRHELNCPREVIRDIFTEHNGNYSDIFDVLKTLQASLASEPMN